MSCVKMNVDILFHIIIGNTSRSQAGYVQTNHGRYFIEPVYQAEPEPDGQHIHLAYKRDAPHEKKGQTDTVSKRHCGTSG